LADPVSILLGWLLDQAKSPSFNGVLLLSFASSLLVFLPVPYYIGVALASSPVFGLDPTVIALYSSVGATAAKVIIFRLSRTSRRLLGQKGQERMQFFGRVAARYGWIAAFVAAATPIPDDLIYVPLGLVGYSLWRFTLATFSGKLLLTLIITWGARASYGFIGFLIGAATDPQFLLATGAFTAGCAILTVYLIAKLDWERLLGRWFPGTADRPKDAG